MIPLQIVGPAYLSRSRSFDASRLVNLYPEMSASGQSKAVAALFGTPGAVRYATGAGGGVRGQIRFSALLAFVVMGGNVYAMDTAGTLSLLATGIVNRTTPVSMASNGTVIMLVTGPEGYVITPNIITPSLSTVTQIIDPAFYGADRVDYIDGYFVFNRPGTQLFQITQLGTTTIDPLDFASAEGAPDKLLSLLVDHREIWLFGENSTEVFFNSGATDFPFERIQGAFIQQGIVGAYASCRFADSVAWLTFNEEGQGTIVKSQGYTPITISTPALEFAIGQYSRIDDAIFFSYRQEGHTFLVCVFPTGNATWVYDANTQLWHERAWRNPADGSLNRIRAQCFMNFANKLLVGDWEQPYLYQWSLDAFTDDGAILPAIRQVPHQASADNTFLIYHKLWLDMETGVGLNGTGQGSDPQLVLEWSDDGGYSFPSGTSRLVPLGKIGERKRRANARRLGKSRDRVFRLTITDPVKRVFIGGGVEGTECAA